jgi:hypothetical protein
VTSNPSPAASEDSTHIAALSVAWNNRFILPPIELLRAKANGKVRTLQIPSIRDRVVRGAVTGCIESRENHVEFTERQRTSIFTVSGKQRST